MSMFPIDTYHVRQAVRDIAMALLPQVNIEEDLTRFCRIFLDTKIVV